MILNFKFFKSLSVLLISICLSKVANSQIAIGPNPPDSSAMLDVQSITRGFLPPRMTSAQILAIRNPKAGLIVYNAFYNQPVFFNGTKWKFFCNDSTMGDGDLSRGLVAYYPFNNNYNDESGNGNSGIPILGASLTTDKNGRANSAINCNGNGQKLVVNNNTAIQFDSLLTVSFNVLIRGYSRHTFVTMVDTSSAAGVNFIIGVNLLGNPHFSFATVSYNNICNIPHVASESNDLQATNIIENTWYNVICTYSRGLMKMYVNGILSGTITSPSSRLRNCLNAKLVIGGWWNGDPQASINGKIDEVRLYNRVLNADEITVLNNAFNN